MIKTKLLIITTITSLMLLATITSGSYQRNVFGAVKPSFPDDHKGRNGQFDAAYGVAVDASGRVYVLDYFNNRIQVFLWKPIVHNTIEPPVGFK